MALNFKKMNLVKKKYKKSLKYKIYKRKEQNQNLKKNLV